MRDNLEIDSLLSVAASLVTCALTPTHLTSHAAAGEQGLRLIHRYFRRRRFECDRFGGVLCSPAVL